MDWKQARQDIKNISIQLKRINQTVFQRPTPSAQKTFNSNIMNNSRKETLDDKHRGIYPPGNRSFINIQLIVLHRLVEDNRKQTQFYQTFIEQISSTLNHTQRSIGQITEWLVLLNQSVSHLENCKQTGASQVQTEEYSGDYEVVNRFATSDGRSVNVGQSIANTGPGTFNNATVDHQQFVSGKYDEVQKVMAHILSQQEEWNHTFKQELDKDRNISEKVQKHVTETIMPLILDVETAIKRKIRNLTSVVDETTIRTTASLHELQVGFQMLRKSNQVEIQKKLTNLRSFVNSSLDWSSNIHITGIQTQVANLRSWVSATCQSDKAQMMRIRQDLSAIQRQTSHCAQSVRQMNADVLSKRNRIYE